MRANSLIVYGGMATCAGLVVVGGNHFADLPLAVGGSLGYPV